ncbi:hypothetical protein ACFX16_003097 [Malus domestica]
MAKFWWAGANKDREIHWINWKDLGRAKKERGMGFSNLKDFNLALLVKQWWRQWWWLIHDLESLWAWVLKERYFPNVSFLEAKKCGRASWAWASLLEVRDLILKGARWQILEGQKVQFWTNNWVPSIPARHLTLPFHTEISSESKVAEFIDLVLRVWNIDLLSHFVPEAERVTISHIQVGSLLRPDKLVWHFERNGSYSVKSVYKWCHNQLPTVNHDRPPSSHSIDSRVNVDACWKGDSLCGHIGVVAKDSLSSCKAVKSVRVFAYSDAMAGSSCSRRMFTGEKLKFTGGANMATDFVVRNMSPEMCGLDWVVIPPSSLVGVLNNDSLPCPLV